MKTIGNPLRSDLLAALELGCAEAGSIAAEGRVPQHDVAGLSRENGYLAESATAEIDWEVFSPDLAQRGGLPRLLSEAAGRLETEPLAAILIGDMPAERRAGALWRYAVVPVLMRYAAERPDWRWDASLARELIDAWAAERTSQAEGTFRTIAPLRHFDGPDDPVPIADGLVIRPFTDRDREDLWREHRQMGRTRIGPIALGAWSHMIDCRWVREPGAMIGHDPGIETAEDVLRALRLHHPGMVSRTLLLTRRDPPTQPRTSPFHQVFMLEPPGDHEGEAMREIADREFWDEVVPRTEIGVADGEAIGELLGKMRAARSERRMALALRRFDSAYSREEDEDSLIDLWIAFEALLLPDGQTELSYRVALRIAALAGSGSEERKAAFKQARSSYKCRSQVVHGEATEDLEEVVAETRELARDVLRAWILDPPADGVEEVDARIFDR